MARFWPGEVRVLMIESKANTSPKLEGHRALRRFETALWALGFDDVITDCVADEFPNALQAQLAHHGSAVLLNGFDADA